MCGTASYIVTLCYCTLHMRLFGPLELIYVMAATQRSPYAISHSSIDDIEKGHLMHEFADAIVRQGFVRKVFGERSLAASRSDSR